MKVGLKQIVKVFLFAIIFVFISCDKNEDSFTDVSGNLISYELIKTLDENDINEIRTLRLQEFLFDASIPYSDFAGKLDSSKYRVKLYRVKYKSFIPEMNNKQTEATGLVAIPDVTVGALPIISYQHGTVFVKSWVPSIPMESYETMFMISQFASQGYILFAADYFGLGNASKEPNSYFVRKSTEQACLDMYKAGLEVIEKLGYTKSMFFVNGWSQGAYNTMLFLRRLERERIPVEAAFTAAAPVDPLLFVTRGLFNPRSFDAEYTVAALCNLLFSIEEYNKLEGITKSYINSDYYNDAKLFYEFKISYDTFKSKVPIKLDEAFTPLFFSDAKNADNKFWQILSSSEAYRWLSPTPLRAYYGLKDEAVPEYIATLAVDYMKTLGKQNAESYNAGNEADHRATYIQSLIDAKPWIDSFK